MNNRITEEDFIGAGFIPVDHVELDHPRKIDWGFIYKSRTIEERLSRAEKLACAMNDAADKLQNERNELNQLCIKKEQQLEKLTAAVQANNDMLQAEVARMNEERQEWNRASANLRSRIRELENGRKSQLSD